MRKLQPFSLLIQAVNVRSMKVEFKSYLKRLLSELRDKNMLTFKKWTFIFKSLKPKCRHLILVGR